jgi:hypothetical protein
MSIFLVTWDLKNVLKRILNIGNVWHTFCIFPTWKTKTNADLFVIQILYIVIVFCNHYNVFNLTQKKLLLSYNGFILSAFMSALSVVHTCIHHIFLLHSPHSDNVGNSLPRKSDFWNIGIIFILKHAIVNVKRKANIERVKLKMNNINKLKLITYVCRIQLIYPVALAQEASEKSIKNI